MGTGPAARAEQITCGACGRGFNKMEEDGPGNYFPQGRPLQFFYFSAIASISQSTPFGSALTATQLRAGLEVKYFA